MAEQTPNSINTQKLHLVVQPAEQVRAMIEQMSPEDKVELSPDWLAQVDAAMTTDPWIHGFMLMLRRNDEQVGNCGFKGPPADGVVEIAYGVAPQHQGKGYATEAARALVEFALRSETVNVVRAHTLPESNASTRVLTKCGFQHVGEVVDPEDGPVWRWEIQRADWEEPRNEDS